MKKCLVIIFPLLLTVFNVKAQVEIVSTGTATAYVVNVPGAFTLRNGLQVTFKAHINCAASPSINVSGSGAIGLRKNGNTTALSAADIIANQIVTIVYDGTFWQMVTNPGTPAAAVNYWTLNGTHIYNNNSGNIGVGITNPTTAKLHIENNAFSGNFLRLNNLFNSNGASILEITTNGSGAGVNVNHTGFGPAGQFEIVNTSSSSNALRVTTNNGNSKALEVLHSGINAGSIDYGVHSTVTGAGNSNTAGYFSATGATTNWAGYFESGNVYIQNSLGLGTITPNNILHLSGSFSSTGMIGSFIDLQNTFGSSTSAAKVGIRFKTSNFPNGQHAKGGIVYSRTSTNARGDIHFLNNSTDDVSEIDISTDTKMIIKNSGDIGIGTSTPTAKLHLEGSLRLNNLSGTAAAIGSVLTSMDAQGNAEWRPIPVSANTWNITGNAGMVDGTNFIGTTDNVPFTIRVNNVQAGKIDASLSNSFYGYWAGRDNSTGTSNTAVGTNALLINTTGAQNTAIGVSSLANNTGSYNTASGYSTLQNNTGTYNTANGHSALSSNTAGNNNTATGMGALFSNTTGGDNTANGKYALSNNINGNFNVATGNNALYSNSSGSTNVATGSGSLYNNTTGNSNTAYGHNTLYSVTNTGTGNTALGYNAGFAGTAITTGTYNTFIGYAASSNIATRTNCIAIAGNSNLALPGDNSVRIGNSSMFSIGGQVGWTTVSDERVKVNVNDNVKGLDFILKLKPVTYNYSIEKSNQLQNIIDVSDWKGKNDIEKTRFSGFLSQEVEKAAEESGYDFSGVDKPQDTNGMWGLRYAEFTVPLVKAIQEQQQMIEQQQVLIEKMQKEIDLLKK